VRVDQTNTPADFEVAGVRVIMVGRPEIGRNVSAFHCNSGMTAAVVDDVNGARRFAGSGRIKRLDRPDTACRSEKI
jgi:hypothetical protein